MLRRNLRLALIFAAVIVVVATIDWASSFIMPCDVYYADTEQEKYNQSDNRCPFRGGVVGAGFEKIGSWGPEVWTAFATIAVAAFTFTLWLSTNRLWEAGKRQVQVAEKALIGSTKATEMLASMERPYVTSGGDLKWHAGKELFELHVENHGKTPTRMTAFDLRFAKLEDLKNEAAARPVHKRYRYIDGISPLGKRKEIPTQIPRPPDVDVIYGAVWYEDIWGDEHCSRFILRISASPDIKDHGLTRLTGMEGVSKVYWSWDYPKKEQKFR